MNSWESPELREARKRAAEVRRQWSSAERQKRAGLPPDTPWALLRTFFQPERRSGTKALRRGQNTWQTAPAVVPR